MYKPLLLSLYIIEMYEPNKFLFPYYHHINFYVILNYMKSKAKSLPISPLTIKLLPTLVPQTR